MKTTGNHENCWKCGGTGRIDAFAHVAHGVCFACGGSGKLEAGSPIVAKDSLACGFVVDGWVWEFEPIHHGPNAHYVARKGQSVDTVILQAYKAGANLRTGTTVLRCRVAPEVARKVFKAAQGGMKPEEMTNAFLGGFLDGYGRPIGDGFETGSCGISRNRRGISPVL